MRRLTHPEPVIEDGEELAQEGDEGELLGFADGKQRTTIISIT